MLSFGPFFPRFTPPLAGLDISPSEVSMVELSRANDGRLHLARYARESLPEGAVTAEGIDHLRPVADAVHRMWDKSGSPARRIALSIPSNIAVTYIITAEAGMGCEQLENIVKLHTAQSLPFPLDQALLDFSVIGPSAARPGRVDVLVAAVRREDVEDRIAVAESLGLQTKVVDIDGYAALAVLRRPRREAGTTSPMILLRLDASGVHAAHICKGRIAHDRFDAATEGLTQHHRLRSYGLQTDDEDADTFEAHRHSIVMRCSQAVQTLRGSAAQIREFTAILLAGPGATLPGLAGAIEKQTGMTTAIAAPFAGMSIEPTIDPGQLNADAPACLVACGLAMRRFDR